MNRSTQFMSGEPISHWVTMGSRAGCWHCLSLASSESDCSVMYLLFKFPVKAGMLYVKSVSV